MNEYVVTYKNEATEGTARIVVHSHTLQGATARAFGSLAAEGIDIDRIEILKVEVQG